MKFSKVLAQYYHGWFRDCHDSAIYCKNVGDIAGENRYLADAASYFDCIINNWDAIEYFSQGHNAFLRESAIPAEFRDYQGV